MLTLELKKSNNQDVIQGKLILNISTNVTAPIRNGNNTITATSSSGGGSSSSRGTITRDASNQSINTQQQASSSQQEPQLSALLPPPHSARNPATSSTEESNSRNNDLPEGCVYHECIKKDNLLNCVYTFIIDGNVEWITWADLIT